MPIDIWVFPEMTVGRTMPVAESTVAWTPPEAVLSYVTTPLLIAIDEYGNTIFNQFQCRKQLPQEITFLRERLADPGDVEMLDELARLIAVVLETPHRYLWFVGD